MSMLSSFFSYYPRLTILTHNAATFTVLRFQHQQACYDHIFARESFSFLCHCEERDSSLTPRNRLRNPGAAGEVGDAAHLSGARNDRKGKVACNDNITMPSPF
jgi:hypothetical protein